MTQRTGLEALQRTLATQRKWATMLGLPLLAAFYAARRIDVINLDLALALKGVSK